MTATTELRFAPAVTAMTAFLEPHRPWLESVLGCPLGDALIFEIELPFGQLAAESLLEGVRLDRGCLDGAATLRPAVDRWTLPPGVTPRIGLEPSRDREAPMLERQGAWDPHWKDTPIAIWFGGLSHAAVAVDIPFVSYKQGLGAEWQHWLLVNRAEVAPLLNRLRDLVYQPRKVVSVYGGHDISLPPMGYDWTPVILSPELVRLVRQDFEHFLQHERWFARHRLPFRRGYLFYGPPGNGKTSAIRVMASHPAVSAFTLDFSNAELGNEALAEVFEAAGRNAPALVLFEDLDRLFGTRSDESHPDNRTQITFQHLLNCLDGLGSQDGVIVVATANDPGALDAALLRRPGRFDRAVPFRAPTEDLRREYLHRLGDGELDPETIRLAAEQSEGFSFAQVREAFILGAQSAFQHGADAIGRDDLLEGVRLVRGEGQAVGQRADGRMVGFGSLATDGGAVMASPERRDFLRAGFTVLAGAAAPAGLAPTGWANADVTPQHCQELLGTLADVDGIRVRKASDDELRPPGGILLGLFRYESAGGLSRTVHRLVLPWMDVRAGLYVRSAVPYRIRVSLEPDEGQLTTGIILDRRTSVTVYRETPRWTDVPAWQVVVMVGTTGVLALPA